jgi:hypothetical protein
VVVLEEDNDSNLLLLLLLLLLFFMQEGRITQQNEGYMVVRVLRFLSLLPE